MRALFVHSHRFKTFGESVYTDGKLPYDVWCRYLEHFQSLTVFGRRQAVSSEEAACLDLSSGPGVSFYWLPDLTSPTRFFTQRRLAYAVLERHIALVDAVIVRLSGFGWIAAKVAAQMGKPWAVEVVGDPFDALWNYGTISGRLLAPIIALQAKYWIARAPFAIYVTREVLQAKYPCYGICSSASNVSLPRATSFGEGGCTALDLLKSKTRPQCGLIGSLRTKYKGLGVAIRALAKMRKDGMDVELRVLGGGDSRRWAGLAERYGVSDLVFFDGVRPAGAAVFAWLHGLDVYIQPSLTEGLPRSLLEAMSCGLPALASSAGGMRELLPARWLHRPGDFRMLASQLALVLKDQSVRLEMGRQNIRECQAYHPDLIEPRRAVFWSTFATSAAAPTGKGGSLG